MSSGSHPWTSQTLATGLLPFLPGWALSHLQEGSRKSEILPEDLVSLTAVSASERLGFNRVVKFELLKS